MELVTDFLLLAASATACFYCWILSKRLKGLTNTKDGFGAGIVALSQSADEMKSAIEQTKIAADDTAERLEALLHKADARVTELQDLLQQFSDMSTSVVSETERATQKYVDTLTPFINEASQTADLLFQALETTSRHGSFDKNDPTAINANISDEVLPRKMTAGASM